MSSCVPIRHITVSRLTAAAVADIAAAVDAVRHTEAVAEEAMAAVDADSRRRLMFREIRRMAI